MAEFTPINTMSVRMNVPMNEGGTIAQSGETITSATKAINFPGIKPTATLAEASTVVGAFMSIAGGSYDSLSAKRTMSGGVTE